MLPLFISGSIRLQLCVRQAQELSCSGCGTELGHRSKKYGALTCIYIYIIGDRNMVKYCDLPRNMAIGQEMVKKYGGIMEGMMIFQIWKNMGIESYQICKKNNIKYEDILTVTSHLVCQ